MAMRGNILLPEGLTYYDNFITEVEEEKILNFIESLEFEQVIMHGQPAKRSVKHFGYHYNYQKFSVEPGEAFPSVIQKLSNKCAEKGGLEENEIVQCLISNYPANSTIGWHTDKFIFGSKIFGISLLSSCLMRFQRKIENIRYVYEKELIPRSLYILSGESRYKWQHSIPPTKGLRYSITFRTLKKTTKL
ncbi:MAG: alpha-ketoglutarate-dependent dioxygenase AlkB [Parachlamydiaceae bacterium]|nr:alpha-ketoglutarate-dependent dioxygenase AlkB [Parachlamydiaceae bacterium]